MATRYYLKDEAYFEPLHNKWYAWPYLIPPVQGAKYLVNTHLRLMKSFVNNYRLHIIANKDSFLTGGEFLDCTEDQVTEIKELIEHLQTDCSDLIKLSVAVTELEDLLNKHTSGESIETLYMSVPDSLRGYVELYVDLEHRASFRLVEPLLYQSKYYRPSLQSACFGLLTKVNQRPFVLSTPRLPDRNHIHIDADFNSQTLVRILQARDNPILEDELDDLFGQRRISGGLSYRELFTERPSNYSHIPVTEGVRVQYTGHAGFLVETSETTILIDPVIANRDENNKDEIISYSQLPQKIDYICLTHNHQDHVNLETLLQLRHKTGKVIVPKNNGGTLADPSIRLLLRQFKFDVVEVDDLDCVEVTGGHITSVPFFGEHGDLNIRSKTAWFIQLLGKKIFFGADTSNPDTRLFDHLQKTISDIDILAIGMECVGAPYTWLYGSLYSKIVPKNIKESRRLNGSDFEQALPLVEIFSPKEVYIYALGIEPWYKYFMGLEYGEDSKQIIESNKLIKACKELGIYADAMYGKKETLLLP